MNASSSQVFSDADVWDVLLDIHMALATYMTPWMAVFGLLSNLLCAIALQRPTVQLSSTVRVYYIWIAVFDALTTVSKDLPFILLGSMLYYLAYGNPTWMLLTSPNKFWLCRVCSFFFGLTEMAATCGILLLTAERVFVLWFPFVARKVVNARKALCGLFLMLIVAVADSSSFLFTGTVTYRVHNYPMCELESDDFLLAVVINVAFICLNAVPTALATGLCFALTYKVRKLVKVASTLGVETSRSKDLRNIASIVLTVLLNDIISIPFGVTYAVLQIVRFLLPENKLLEMQLTNLWVFLCLFGVIQHSVNFPIYWLTVPGFQKTVKSIFRLRCPGYRTSVRR